jgi:hypothetical protein
MYRDGPINLGLAGTQVRELLILDEEASSMFSGVPAIILLLPSFAFVMIAMIWYSSRATSSEKVKHARSRQMVEPRQRSWFDHEDQGTEERPKKRAA